MKLIAENRGRLLKICRVYAWGRPDQDDLYQEILFQLWRALPNLREASHADTWLYRIALNTAISFVRKDKSRRGRVVSGVDEAMREVPDTRLQRKSEIEECEEKVAELWRAIAQLNDAEKAIITLFLEDLNYEQIAAVLGVTENKVGVMLHRAKKKLSCLMVEEAPK